MSRFWDFGLGIVPSRTAYRNKTFIFQSVILVAQLLLGTCGPRVSTCGPWGWEPAQARQEKLRASRASKERASKRMDGTDGSRCGVAPGGVGCRYRTRRKV